MNVVGEYQPMRKTREYCLSELCMTSIISYLRLESAKFLRALLELALLTKPPRVQDASYDIIGHP